ncbi:MAG: N-acetylmuramoyl-L-alanine amidase, partial [Flavobacteriaceae bacterium]
MKLKRAYFLALFIIFQVSHTSVRPFDGPNDNDPFTVVLDAGHGGHDPGNLGNGYLEKKIALSIVLKVGEILERNPDIKVIYTRKDDTFVDLYLRGEIANKANADLFVSVHCDSHGSDAYGAGTFVLGLHANKQNFEIAKKENSVIYLEDNYETRYADYDINSPESIIGLTIMQEEFLDQSIALAKAIQDNFSKRLKRKNRQVKQAGFIVLHQTFMPSVLVETGFLTNKNEGAYLNSSKGQMEMGKAIADAILTYKKSVRGQTPQGAAPKPVVENREQVVGETGSSSGTMESVAANEPKENDSANEKKEEPSEKPVETTGQKSAQNSEETKTGEIPTKTEVTKEVKSGIPLITFKVQLMAGSKKIALEPENFKGLNDISKEAHNGLYRYMYGVVSTYNEAKSLRS